MSHSHEKYTCGISALSQVAMTLMHDTMASFILFKLYNNMLGVFPGTYAGCTGHGPTGHAIHWPDARSWHQDRTYQNTEQCVCWKGEDMFILMKRHHCNLILFPTEQLWSGMQIYVEIERARLIKKLAKIKEEQKLIGEAADLMQEVAVSVCWPSLWCLLGLFCFVQLMSNCNILVLTLYVFSHLQCNVSMA